MSGSARQPVAVQPGDSPPNVVSASDGIVGDAAGSAALFPLEDDSPSKLRKKTRSRESTAELAFGTIEVPKSRILLKGCREQGLISAIVGPFMGLSCIALYGPAIQVLRSKLRLGPIDSAVLLASPVFVGSLLRVPFGAYADTAGACRLLTLQLMACTGGMLCISMVMKEVMKGSEENPAEHGYYWQLLLFGALSGAGISTFPVGLSQVSYWYPREAQGTVLGIYGGALAIAPGLASCLLPLAFDRMGVVKAYFTWVGLLILGTMSYYTIGLNSWYFQLRDMGFNKQDSKNLAMEHGQELFPMSAGEREQEQQERPLWGEMMEVLRTAVANWKTWALVSLYSCAFGGQVAVIGWLSLYWHEQHHLRPATSGFLTAVFTLAVALARGASGPLNAQLGGEISSILFFGITALAALLIAVSRWLPFSILCLMLLALGQGVCCNASFKLVPQEVPEAVGGAAGLVSGFGCFGGFLLQPLMAIFPKVLHRNGYSWGFLVIFFLALANIWVSFLLLRHSSVGQERKQTSTGDSLMSQFCSFCRLAQSDEAGSSLLDETNSMLEETFSQEETEGSSSLAAL